MNISTTTQSPVRHATRQHNSIISIRLTLGLLTILILMLPLHTGIFQVLEVELKLSSSVRVILGLWKELVLVAIVVLTGLRYLSVHQRRFTLPKIVLITLLFVAVGVFGLIQSPSLLMGIYAFRGTFQPFILLATLFFIPFDPSWLYRLLKRIWFVGFIVSAFSIFQTLVLGYDYLWRYYARSDTLSYSFSFMGGQLQRAMGTFASPNQLSLYLVFMIIFAVNYLLRMNDKGQRRHLLLFLLTSVVALILTVSRSGWIALAVGLGITFLTWRRKYQLVPYLVIGSIGVVVLVMQFGLDQHIISTLSGREVSANYHVQLTISNLQTIWGNPLGVGLGWVGARATRFDQNFQRLYTESYILQLGLELGIQGILLFGMLVVVSVMQIYVNIFRVQTLLGKVWTVASLSCLVAAMSHALFIPDLQDLAVGSYLWFFVGIALRLPLYEFLTRTGRP